MCNKTIRIYFSCICSFLTSSILLSPLFKLLSSTLVLHLRSSICWLISSLLWYNPTGSWWSFFFLSFCSSFWILLTFAFDLYSWFLTIKIIKRLLTFCYTINFLSYLYNLIVLQSSLILGKENWWEFSLLIDWKIRLWISLRNSKIHFPAVSPRRLLLKLIFSRRDIQSLPIANELYCIIYINNITVFISFLFIAFSAFCLSI